MQPAMNSVVKLEPRSVTLKYLSTRESCVRATAMAAVAMVAGGSGGDGGGGTAMAAGDGWRWLGGVRKHSTRRQQ